MPGLGHIYAGSFVGGLLRYLALFFAALVFLLAWRLFHFQPHLPVAVMSLATVGWVGLLVGEVWARTGPAARGYVLQGFNHPFIYGGLLLCCHLVPAGLLIERTFGPVVATVEVRDGGMFPMLFIGDRVLVDRTAYRTFPPERGELAVVRDPQTLRPLVRRVAAAPRDTISFEGRVPVVNLEALPQEELGTLSLSGADNHGLPTELHLEGYSEESGGRQYTVTHRPDHPHDDRQPLQIERRAYFVLSDNRDDGRDSRHFGPVPRAAVLGRPLHVLWSRDPAAESVVWNRTGLAAR